MISIIICSRNAILSESIVKNIAETVGVEYEIISVDNSENKVSFHIYVLYTKMFYFIHKTGEKK